MYLCENMSNKFMADKLSIIWWNTSLSPSKKRDRADIEQHEAALIILAALVKKYSLDIISLGEVSPNDIVALKKIFNDGKYGFYDGSFTNSDCRINHDLCVIYNKEKLVCLNSKDITKQSYMGAIRAGHELHFQHLESLHDFFIYILHWPSRNHIFNEDSVSRFELGRTVRDAIEKCISKNNAEYFIITGDFNDEPFNDSIVKGLGATRDRSIVLDKEQLLYNPFWRHIGHKESLDEYSEKTSWGTCYYKGDKFSKWKTFDQIIFSSAFIKKSHWFLKEDSVKILRDFNLEDLIYNSKYNFDHLPVMASLERVN